MKIYLKIFSPLALAGLTVALVFGGQTESKPDGAAIFKQKCSMCHGADGKGYSAIKTPDFTDPKWQADNKDKDILEVIRNGKKGTAMPAFAEKLKEDEIQAVLGQIRAFGAEKKKK